MELDIYNGSYPQGPIKALPILRRKKMPNYDYMCLNCQKIYEISVRLDKIDEKIKCPNCKKKLKKRIHAPKIVRIN